MSKPNTKRGAQAPLFGSQVQLHIEKLAIGGNGVARLNGMVVFVSDVAPNEDVLAEITSVKKNFLEAKVVQIIRPSPSRRRQPCPVAELCGGCNWQHLTEEEQLRQKESLVLETLKKFNPELDFVYHPIQKSPKSWRYRNRIQPKYLRGQFGFFARGSHKIVETSDCLITEEVLTNSFADLKDWASQKNSPELLKLELYLSDKNQIRYGLITDEDDGVGFSQVNRFQNSQLLETSLFWAGDASYRQIHELYAGAGNFSFPLAHKYPHSHITAVELNPKLVKKGHAQNQVSHLAFVESAVEKYLEKADIQTQDLVFLDPPRAGATREIMEKLAQCGPQKIIYISCHPVSLARDLSWFFARCRELNKKARLVQVQAFEMFPQTDHVETIAELRVDS
jgi:23S rRNA (uracil1939-C5)-methyltransferase